MNLDPQAVARARRARMRAIGLRHRNRAARKRSRELVADSLRIMGRPVECWVVTCTEPGVIEAIGAFEEPLQGTGTVAVGLCLRHAWSLRDDLVVLSFAESAPSR